MVPPAEPVRVRVRALLWSILVFAQISCGAEPRTAYLVTKQGSRPASYSISAYRIGEDGAFARFQSVDTAEPYDVVIHPSGRFLYVVESREGPTYGAYLRTFRIESDGELIAQGEFPIEEPNESPWDIVVSRDSLFLVIDNSGTGPSYRVKRYAMSEDGALVEGGTPRTCAVLPPAFLDATGLLLPGRNGIVWLRPVGYGQRSLVRYDFANPGRASGPSLGAVPSMSAAAVHPTEPLVFAAYTGSLVTYRMTDAPTGLEPLSRLERGVDPSSLAVSADAAWLLASSNAGIESFAINSDGRLELRHTASANLGTLVVDPAGAFVYLVTGRANLYLGEADREQQVLAFRARSDGSLQALGQVATTFMRGIRGRLVVGGPSAGPCSSAP